MSKKDRVNEKHQVIILQKGAELPDGLRQSLQSKGFSTRVVLSEHEAGQAIAGLERSVLVVYCGVGVDTLKVAETLVAQKQLHTAPVIIVGENADRFESVLNKSFVLATTLTLPCSSPDILAAVEYVVRYVSRIRSRQVEKRTPEEERAVEEKILHDVYKQFPSIPRLVFDQLNKLGILTKDLGGGLYATTFRPEKLENRSFLPLSSRIREQIQEIEKSINARKRSRVYRVAHLSSLLFNALGISGETLEAARGASFLYTESFVRTERDIFEKDYLLNDLLRNKLCSRIKDSAINLSTSGGDVLQRKLVLSIAKFIGSEELPSDSTEDIAASCIAAADMVDRVVFQRGAFQPVSAYCLLAKLKIEPLSQLHPLVLGCLVKILAEAVTSQAGNISKSKKLQVVPTLMNAAEPISNLVLGDTEKPVHLASLMPGMRLSRNVATYDGRELLDPDVRLDQDLIWRLWQLAAIRPLAGPVIVSTDS